LYKKIPVFRGLIIICSFKQHKTSPLTSSDDELLKFEQLIFASGGYYMFFGPISQTIVCYNLLGLNYLSLIF